MILIKNKYLIKLTVKALLCRHPSKVIENKVSPVKTSALYFSIQKLTSAINKVYIIRKHGQILWIPKNASPPRQLTQSKCQKDSVYDFEPLHNRS